MKDFNVKITVRNNRLLRAIEDQFGTSAQFCRESKISPSKVSAFLTMKETPVGVNGWKPSALDVASALGVHPVDIWPDHLQDVRLKSSTAQLELTAPEVAQIAAHAAMDQAEARDLIVKMSSGLQPRLMDFLAWRVSQGANATIQECGQYLGVTAERARQIEAKMMRKMRDKAKRLGIETLD